MIRYGGVEDLTDNDDPNNYTYCGTKAQNVPNSGSLLPKSLSLVSKLGTCVGTCIW